MSTLKELVLAVEDEPVEEALRRWYPELDDGVVLEHIRVLHVLRDLEPTKNDDFRDALFIRVKLIHEEEYDDEVEFNHYVVTEYADVSGISETGEALGLSFTPWECWLRLPVEADGHLFTYPELVAHCLWEMTFISSDPDEIRAAWIDIVGRAAEVNQIVEAGMDPQLFGYTKLETGEKDGDE